MENSEQKKKDRMFDLIRQWESSGQKREAFSKQHGITVSCFGYWRTRYLREKNKHKQEKAFIPVKLASKQQESVQKPMSNGSIELEYPNGVKLSCPEHIDLSRLKTLILL